MPITDERVRRRLESLEREAREHPRRHAVRVWAAIGAGYLFPFGLVATLLLLVAGILWLAPVALRDGIGRDIIELGICVVALLFLAAYVVDGSRVKLDPPEGVTLRPSEAGQLRALVNHVADHLHARRIDQIVIDDEYNAGVTETSPSLLLRRSQSYLIIGLPLLLGLDVNQLSAVLAHEFAHIRRKHLKLTLWAYRLNRIWELLAQSSESPQVARRPLLCLFARWYGPRLNRVTLPHRRMHEYEADRLSVEFSGRDLVAGMLCRFYFTGEQLSRRFEEGVLRQAAYQPVPPGDYLEQMRRFLSQPTVRESVVNWAARQRSLQTPIESAHPSLADRLAAIGAAHLLSDGECADVIEASSEAGSASAESLLGNSVERVHAGVSSLWKRKVISRWRMEHAASRAIAEEAEGKTRDAGLEAAAWRQIRHAATFGELQESRGTLETFLSKYPNHAEANFVLGRILLILDDDQRAIHHYETAMASDSDFSAAALTTLLSHYRHRGLDEAASRTEARLREFERSHTRAGREAARFDKGEELVAHDLNDDDLHAVRRILRGVPRIRAAYLARKASQALADKSIYVVLVEFRSSAAAANDHARQYVKSALESQLQHYVAVVPSGRRNRALAATIRQVCPMPVFADNN